MQQSDALALAEDEQDGENGGATRDEMMEKDLKREIREMQEEKRQQRDYRMRLQRKITKLNAALADVVEEEEGLRRKQDHELKKKDNEVLSLKREMNLRASNQDKRIREYLSDVLYTKPVSKGKHFDLDTVKVTNQRFQHPLAFRIDDSTTVMKLRNNACKYWNVTPEDFILKTMANNKCSDDIRVKDCFKQGELAQLRLEEKRLEPSKPSEEELKAIMPKNTKQKKVRHRDPRYNAEGIETIQRHVDSYAVPLRKMGGIYFLLKLRDMKPSEHCSKIKLRDIIIYSVLALLSIFVYFSRRPYAQDYWFVKSIEDAFSRTSHKPMFQEVSSTDGIWTWLGTSLPGVIWNDGSFGLGAYNLLVGYMSIRVKNVVSPNPPWESCGDAAKAFVQQLGGTCYPMAAEGGDEEKADIPALVNYWAKVTQQDATDPSRIRGDVDPGKYASAEANYEQYQIGTIAGNIASYSAGGYSVHYRMDASNLTKARTDFRNDLAILRQADWISVVSRLVVVSFTCYNFQYDMWLANDFLFEIPPSGAVKSFALVRPFKPRMDDSASELVETRVDMARVMIAIYILVFVGMSERRHKIKYHKAGVWYHVSLNGVADYGICACIWVVVLWRVIGFREPVVGVALAEADVKFRSYSDLAIAYNNIFAIEGLMMVFLSLRMLSFIRLNHTVYLLWNALGNGFKSFLFFTLMFVPTMVGFVFLLHASYGTLVEKYATIQRAFVQFYKIFNGDLLAGELLHIDAGYAVFLTLFFYMAITFLLMNIFASIVIDAHYMVQVTMGGSGEKWTWNRYYRWAVPGLLVNLIQAMAPGQHMYTENA